MNEEKVPVFQLTDDFFISSTPYSSSNDSTINQENIAEPKLCMYMPPDYQFPIVSFLSDKTNLSDRTNWPQLWLPPLTTQKAEENKENKDDDSDDEPRQKKKRRVTKKQRK